VKSNIFVTILANEGDLYFCQYESGLYTVDKSNKNVGMTLKASFDKQEIQQYFNELIKH